MKRTQRDAWPNGLPSRDRRHSVATAGVAGLLALVAVVGAWNTDGFVSIVLTIGFFTAVAAVVGAGHELFVLREPLANVRTRERRSRMYALSFLILFFTVSATLLAWVVGSPNGGCVDCDSTGGRVLFWSILLSGWGMALVCVREIVAVRRDAHANP